MTKPLLEFGAALCIQNIDILGSLPPDRSFFEQSPIEFEELDVYKLLAEQLKKTAADRFLPAEQHKILDLALRFIPGRHKMPALPTGLQGQILAARIKFRHWMSSQARIQRLPDTRLKGKTTLIAVVHRLDIIKNFDKIGVLKSGKIEEIGTYGELMEKRGLLYEFATGRKQ